MTQFKEFLEFVISEGQEFCISNPVMNIEYDYPKYYLLQIGGSDLTVAFKCYCPLKVGAHVQIFSGPTITYNGFPMSQSIPLVGLNVYQNTTVSDNGVQIHSHICPADRYITDNFIFNMGTYYLIKITPKVDRSEIVVLT